jgi:hypothetical protein
VRSVGAQHRVVTALENRGARIAYDFRAGVLGEPEISWLKRIGGEDWLYSVELVAFYDRPCGREELELLARLSSLRELSLLESDLTDEDLACLASLGALKRLRIHGSPLGDEALKVLAKAPRLDDLALDGDRITSAGLVELSRFPSLETCVLRQTCVEARDIEALRCASPQCRFEIGDSRPHASADKLSALAMHGHVQ